jgi:hypothetical protein
MIVDIILILSGIYGMSAGEMLFGFLVMMLGIIELLKDHNQPTEVSPIIIIAGIWCLFTTISILGFFVIWRGIYSRS